MSADRKEDKKLEKFVNEKLGGDQIPALYADSFIAFGSRIVSKDLQQAPAKTRTIRKLAKKIPVKNAIEPYEANVYNEVAGAPRFANFYTELSSAEMSDKLDPQKSFEFCCDCTDACSSNCPCLDANRIIADEDGYSTYKDGFISVQGNPFGPESFIVACGKKCACYKQTGNSKKCTHNIDKFVPNVQFEIFCANTQMGFCLRTVFDILLGGQLIGELTGEILENSDNDIQDNAYYGMDLFDGDPASIDYLAKKLRKLRPFKGKREKTLKEALGNGHSIQTARKSSLLRLTSHSCLPNCSSIKIVANNFHPSHHRIFFVSLHPICAGSELSIFYGEKYINRSFPGACLCGTSACLKKYPTRPSQKVKSSKKEIVAICGRYLKSCVLKVYPEMDKGTSNIAIQKKRRRKGGKRKMAVHGWTKSNGSTKEVQPKVRRVDASPGIDGNRENLNGNKNVQIGDPSNGINPAGMLNQSNNLKAYNLRTKPGSQPSSS